MLHGRRLWLSTHSRPRSFIGEGGYSSSGGLSLPCASSLGLWFAVLEAHLHESLCELCDGLVGLGLQS